MEGRASCVGSENCHCPIRMKPWHLAGVGILLLLSRGGHLHFPSAFAGVAMGRATITFMTVVAFEPMEVLGV